MKGYMIHHKEEPFSWKLLAPEFRVVYKPRGWVSDLRSLFAFGDKQTFNEEKPNS